MRIRKRNWIDEEISSSSFFVSSKDLKDKIKEKKKQFGFEKIELEIGTGKGYFISEIASENLDTLYIGSDIAGTMLGIANKTIREKYFKKNIVPNNIILTDLNAEYILETFLGLNIEEVYSEEFLKESLEEENLFLDILEDDKEEMYSNNYRKGMDSALKEIFEMEVDEDIKVDKIYLNFPNPWPKNRHKKRRLTHPRQIKKYLKIMKDISEIFFKTDDKEFFEESLAYILNINKFSYKYQKEYEKYILKHKEEFIETIQKQIEKIENIETEEDAKKIILPEIYVRKITYDLTKEDIFKGNLGNILNNIETEHEKMFKAEQKNIYASIINRRK